MGARHFGVKAETTYGTAVVPDRFFEALSESVQKELNMETIEVIRQFSPVDLVLLGQAVRGDTEILAMYDGIGILFEHLIGSVDSSTGTPSSGFTTHTIPASTGIPSADRIGKMFTSEYRRDGSLNWRYAGIKIVSVSHSFGTDQSSRMTVGFIGLSENRTAPVSSPTFSSILPMSPTHVSFSMDGTSLPARNVTIDVENPLDEPNILGQTTFGREPDRNGLLRVTGTAEVLYENHTQAAKFDGTTVVDIAIAAVNGTYSLTYNMNKVKLTQTTPHNSGRDRLVATYEWESYYDTDATENLQVVLVNGDETP